MPAENLATFEDLQRELLPHSIKAPRFGLLRAGSASIHGAMRLGRRERA